MSTPFIGRVVGPSQKGGDLSEMFRNSRANTYKQMGLPLVCLWSASGLPLACLWPASGLPLACLWPASGLPVGVLSVDFHVIVFFCSWVYLCRQCTRDFIGQNGIEIFSSSSF